MAAPTESSVIISVQDRLLTCSRVCTLVLHHQDVPDLPGQEGQRRGAHVTEEPVRQGTLEDLHGFGDSLVKNLLRFFLLGNILLLRHPADAQ